MLKFAICLCVSISLLIAPLADTPSALRPRSTVAQAAPAILCTSNNATGVITGRVTAMDANDPQKLVPLARVRVTATCNDDLFFGESGFTNEDGYYTIYFLRLGADYHVYFDPDDEYLGQWYNDKPSHDLANTVSVTSVMLVTNINATVKRGSHIYGRVKASDTDLGLSDVSVTVVFSDGKRYSQPNPSPTGEYKTHALGPGAYKLFFDTGLLKSNRYSNEWYAGKGDEATANTITVPVTATNIVLSDTSLTVRGQITGVVTNKTTGLPVAGINVYALTDFVIFIDGLYSTTDNQGRYDIFVPSGQYHVWSHPNSPLLITSFAETVTITAPNVISNVNMALPTGGVITGQITYPYLTESKTDVWIYEANSGQLINVVEADIANAHVSSFKSRGLPSGQYKLWFVPHPDLPCGIKYCPPARFYSEFYNRKGSLSTADVITVTMPETTTNINVEMYPNDRPQPWLDQRTYLPLVWR